MKPASKKSSFAQRVESSKSDRIFLVRAKDTSGRNAWYYVLTHHGKRDAFKACNGISSLALTDYGDILYSGYGNDPPADTIEKMANEYGFKE